MLNFLFDVRYKKFSTKEGITYMVSAEPVEKGYSRYKFTRRLSEAQFDKIIGLSNNGVWLTVEECEIIFNDGERTYTARFHDYQELDGYVNKDDDYKLDIRNKMIEYLTKNNRNDNLSKINELLQDDYPGIKFDSYEFVIPSSANIKNVVTETNKS